MQWFGKDPHSPLGILQKNRYEAYLKKVNDHFVIKRDPYFKNQFLNKLKLELDTQLELIYGMSYQM